MKILLSLLSILLFSNSYSQTGSVQGTILNHLGKSERGILVGIDNASFLTETNNDGSYKIDDIESGNYTMYIVATGLDTVKRAITVTSNQSLQEDFQLTEPENRLGGVTILGFSEVDKVNKQAYNVTAIDAKKLYNSTLDISHALDRVSGVRVRESGGVGSNINVNLNGYFGNQVRFFLDGIPMENFGSSMQVNNIPINFAERVEVYKGVVPIWLGSDALGGAINIVTGNRHPNYIDVSYSYGSFNTHRSTLNAAYTSPKGFTVQLNAYQNYSDNNYKVTVDVADVNTGKYEPQQVLRRFHDKYHNEMLVANIGVVNKKWTDMLLVGVVVGQSYKEIQTGARMVSVFGKIHSTGNIIMPTIRYGKDNFLLKRLNATFYANHNFGKEQIVDTFFRRYNWRGDFKQFDGPGAERSRSLFKYGDNVSIASASLSYSINDKQSIGFNNTLSSFSREGEDALIPDEQEMLQPQRTTKNVTGISYQYNVNEKWTTTIFGKILYQNSFTRIEDYSYTSQVKYIDKRNKSFNFGYGLATSYYIISSLQAKFSYEKANRLPENAELFGDNVNQDSNYDLKPEHSNNVNVGLSYSFDIKDNHRFMIGATGIYRYATDFIYFRLNNNQAKTIADNLGKVSTVGAEFEAHYSYKNRLVIGANGTYQNIRNMTRTDDKGKPLTTYKDRIPNIPFGFIHGSASLFFDDVFTGNDKLSFGYNIFSTYAFYLFWPSQGGSKDKLNIPSQLSHDISIVYTLKNGSYNVALECNNITNEQLFDNFSLEKPGRSFYLKLRYFYTK